MILAAPSHAQFVPHHNKSTADISRPRCSKFLEQVVASQNARSLLQESVGPPELNAGHGCELWDPKTQRSNRIRLEADHPLSPSLRVNPGSLLIQTLKGGSSLRDE